MNKIGIEIKDNIDHSKIHEPYVIKNYAQDWYAYKNWSFKYLEKLDPFLSINTVIGGE